MTKTIKIDEDLHQRVALAARQQKRKIQELVEAALREALKAQGGKRK